ncbi:MAG: hypothetical protein PHU64_07255 [Candidatus Omnitrophica bacterium]|nr:hypothetical protein [Candidatus Omnitrophota bacterium]
MNYSVEEFLSWRGYKKIGEGSGKAEWISELTDTVVVALTIPGAEDQVLILKSGDFSHKILPDFSNFDFLVNAIMLSRLSK